MTNHPSTDNPPTTFNQSHQTITGSQTNVAGDLHVHVEGAEEVAKLLTASLRVSGATSPSLEAFEPYPFEPITVLIPAGHFVMGSEEGASDERPCHELFLSVFRIGIYPVTNREYGEFLKRNPQVRQPDLKHWFQRRPKAGMERLPVVNLNWQEAWAYCRWLGEVTSRAYALPSEAQWEKAARGGDRRRYPWGEEWQAGCANVNGVQTTPVDAHALGLNPYGCYDLLGNVEEWTSTVWSVDEQSSPFAYPYRSDDGREESAISGLRVHRGGSYRTAPEEIGCTTRRAIHQDSRVPWRGLRVVINQA